jgi:ankyrin repeat protein
VERGATTRLKDAAALGLMDRLQAQFSAAEPPSQEQITEALWAACHGGQRPSAEFLLARGADVNWIGWGELTALDVATQEHHDDLVGWLRAQGAK